MIVTAFIVANYYEYTYIRQIFSTLDIPKHYLNLLFFLQTFYMKFLLKLYLKRLLDKFLPYDLHRKLFENKDKCMELCQSCIQT